MPVIRLGLAQINPVVGDISGNTALCLDAVSEAAGQGAQLIVLPEMIITGYPIEDLALRNSFQAASEKAVADLARQIDDAGFGECVVLVGYLRTAGGTNLSDLGTPDGKSKNSAAVIHRGAVVAHYDKHHLPNYGVFDEYRYFVPGTESLVVRAFNVDIAIAICEDLWQEGGSVARVRDLECGLLAVLNGSPFERDKDDVRLELVQRRARETNSVLAYVNMVGGQDELVFDGDSIVVTPNGEILARTVQFESTIAVFDVELPMATGHADVVLDSTLTQETVEISGIVTDRLDWQAEVYGALVLGLRDYVNKNGFRSVLLGLSGGIDSAFVAALACDALGADRVFGVSMPSEYSSAHSKSDATDTAKRLGINIRTVEIAPMIDAYLNSLGLTGLAEENLQARVRGTTLMGISNQENHLVLATGNKSELSVGYSTIYGDAVGGFAPIKDVPKVDVWELSR